MIITTIPRLAMVTIITHHALRRYIQRRNSLPCFILDDLIESRPLTKGRMKKLGLDRRRGFNYLRTRDGLIFVIAYGRVVTCYYEKTKVSTYEITDTAAERGGHASRRPRRPSGTGRDGHV